MISYWGVNHGEVSKALGGVSRAYKQEMMGRKAYRSGERGGKKPFAIKPSTRQRVNLEYLRGEAKTRRMS